MDPLLPLADFGVGLAPRGGGDANCRLVDWVLEDPGLARLVLSYLLPIDVLGLRRACPSTRAAVAAHPWDTALPGGGWDPCLLWRGETVAAFVAAPSFCVRNASGDGLRRWRACFPAARVVVVVGGGSTGVAAAGGGLEALAGVTRLGLANVTGLTAAHLAPLAPALRVLSLHRTPITVSTGDWAALAGRLTGFVASSPHHFTLDAGAVRALTAATTHLTLVGFQTAAAVTAAMALPRLVALELAVTPSWDGGAGLASCGPRLQRLVLRGTYLVPTLRRGALGAVAASLRYLALIHVGSTLLPGDLSPTPLVALEEAAFEGVPSVEGADDDGVNYSSGTLTSPPLPRLRRLTVTTCAGFTGGCLPRVAPALAALEVVDCDDFTGDTLGGSALTELTLDCCCGVTAASLTAALTALTALERARFDSMPALTDAALAAVDCPRLASLAVSDCDNITGSTLKHLGALRQLTVEGSRGFTAGRLPRGLTTLVVRYCTDLYALDLVLAARALGLRVIEYTGSSDLPPCCDDYPGGFLTDDDNWEEAYPWMAEDSCCAVHAGCAAAALGPGWAVAPRDDPGAIEWRAVRRPTPWRQLTLPEVLPGLLARPGGNGDGDGGGGDDDGSSSDGGAPGPAAKRARL
jgi:hypothetical protein